MTSLHWGILGAGRIAGTFSRGVQHSATGKLAAVGSRTLSKAEAFAKEHDIPQAHGRYDDLLADSNVEAVYIATPHPEHAYWAIRAAEAGKHILIEKPLALNFHDAEAVFEAARAHDVFAMEAFMYRCHPQTAKLVELVRDGAIGDLRVIQAAFSFRAGDDPESRLMNNALGGGGILDVGCYPVSVSRLLAGVVQGKPFADPHTVRAVGHLGETGVDEHTSALLAFADDLIAEVTTGVRLNRRNHLELFGTDGMIRIWNPWQPAKEGGRWEIEVTRKGETEKIEGNEEIWLYGHEADFVARHIGNRQASSPGMSWEDTLGNLRTLDRWRKEIGLVYDEEKPENDRPAIDRRPVTFPAPSETPMKYARLPGVDKDLSRLVMGVDNQHNYPHAQVMFDDFFRRGGNVFDTSVIYGGGNCEKMLGHWMANRGVQAQVSVIVKGVHHPTNYPWCIAPELNISLERLQLECADIYMMHRDNPDIPVGEFIEALNELYRAGRIKVFGGSNWSLARIEEANTYAAEKGLEPMRVVSNNFSLARMVDPVWDNCIAASDPDSRAWLEEHQMPLLAWSSQARGFFTDRAGPDKREDRELVRCWYSDDNFQRRERAIKLAEEKGVTPINIALAYVLSQPFPTFCLIGPRRLSETRTTWPGLEVALTAAERAWLNLESDER